MVADAAWGIMLSAVGIIAVIVQKSRCYVRQRIDDMGKKMPPEYGIGFTERPLVPRINEDANLRNRHD